MDFLDFVIDKCLIVVPVLSIIGIFLKRTPIIPNWLIPFILLAIGITLCVALSLRPESGMGVVDAIIQGVLVTGAAVFIHQGSKQLKACAKTEE